MWKAQLTKDSVVVVVLTANFVYCFRVHNQFILLLPRIAAVGNQKNVASRCIPYRPKRQFRGLPTGCPSYSYLENVHIRLGHSERAVIHRHPSLP